MSTTAPHVTALAHAIRSLHLSRPARATAPAPAPLPPDLAALADALATASGYVSLGQWELELGTEADAEALLRRAQARPAPRDQHLLVLARNQGAATLLAGFAAGGGATSIYCVDREYREVARIGTLDDWIGRLLEDEREADIDMGLMPRVRAALR